MIQSRYLPALMLLCFSLGCTSDPSARNDSGFGGASGTAGSGHGGGSAAGGHANLGGMGGAATGGAATGGAATGGAATGGAATGGAATGGAAMGGAAMGGTANPSGGSANGGTAPTAGAGGGETVPRTTCPTAPPAVQKAPAGDRTLAVSKDAYSALLTINTPFEGTRGTLPFHLYSPSQATENPGERFPLLVVLHGGYGREVTDGNILVDVAPYLLGSQNGLLTESNRAAFPTYVVLPHCRVEEGCTFGSNEWSSAGGAHFQIQPEPSIAGGTALELIEHLIATYSIDPQRVYLTGNSMGGGGSWEFASRRPELFAAVLPVSGHPPADASLTPIADAKLPIWAFGGDNDSSNPYADTVNAVDIIAGAEGCAWLTTYTGTGHDDALWSSPYLEPEIWSWLFAQRNTSAPQ